MTTPIEQLSFIPTGATAKRTLGDWTGDVINVKNCGALGDGSNNDTASIQSALDIAFGTAASPHGHTFPNFCSNKAVYFPPGHYKVQSPHSRTKINSLAQNGGTLTLRYTTDTNHNLATNDLVYIGDIEGGSGDFNGTRKITVVSATEFDTQTKPSYNNQVGIDFTNAYVYTPALTVADVSGGLIFGSGMGTTVIELINSDGIIFQTNGFQYSSIKDIYFKSSGDGSISVLIDLDGATGSTYGGVSQNVFDCLYFDGSGNARTSTGLSIGATNLSQGDQSQFRNCYWNQCRYGLIAGRWFNFNSLGHQVLGGQCLGCSYGILVQFGTIGVIAGTNFEQSTTYDVYMGGATSNQVVIMGCRSESQYFCRLLQTEAVIIGCAQEMAFATGVFCIIEKGGTLIQCTSQFGTVDLQSGGVVDGCDFGQPDSAWLVNQHAVNITSRNLQTGGTWGGLYPFGGSYNPVYHTAGIWYCDASSNPPLYMEGAGFAQTKNGAFTTSDVAPGAWIIGRDTSGGGTTKLYYNNAGTLMVVPLV